jgi:hypothetical protein
VAVVYFQVTELNLVSAGWRQMQIPSNIVCCPRTFGGTPLAELALSLTRIVIWFDATHHDMATVAIVSASA